MSGVNREIVYSVARIRSTFTGATEPLIVRGTGFWVGRGGLRAFVTNRHSLDPELIPETRCLELSEVEIELRHLAGNLAYSETHFFPVSAVGPSIRLHPTADCAVLIGPQFNCPAEFKDQVPISLDDIANQEFLAEKAQIMDFASFIGFPGSDEAPGWDESANLPIARLASIASAPDRSFVNSVIQKTVIQSGDIVLVNGLSFSGSSGSPVFLHRKGIRATLPLVADFVPATVIGIMSGHGTEPGPLPEILQHTGLSYFTRSTSILELLKESGT